MPWNTASVYDARERFIRAVRQRHLSVAQACRQAGISRKTGFKFLARYHQSGTVGLQDASRRPQTFPAQISIRWRKAILKLRQRHACWGGKKIYHYLRRHHPYQRIPHPRTIQRVLSGAGPMKPRKSKAPKGPLVAYRGLTAARHSNHVWTIDFKGWVRTADGVRQEPLTVRDLFSRYGFCIRLLGNQEDRAVRQFLRGLFQRQGMPQIIRGDNGSPFAGKGALGLSRLSVWWLRRGIRVQLTRPARPGDNAAHEQFHGCYQREVVRGGAGANRRALQRRSNRWLQVYNEQRPNEALGGKTPADLYQPSSRKFGGEPLPLHYPRGWKPRTVRNHGAIKWRGRLRHVGRAFIGQIVGLKELKNSSAIWRVYLGKLLIGEMHQRDRTGLRPAKQLQTNWKKA